MQFGRHARAAISPFEFLGVYRFHFFYQLIVLMFPLALMPIAALVITASGYFEGIAKLAEGKLIPHFINQRMPSCGSSARMLAAFFKISRCLRRYSFSRRSFRFSSNNSSADAPARPFSPTAPKSDPALWPRIRLRQVRRLLTLTPSSRATWLTGFPLVRNSSTASRRNSSVYVFPVLDIMVFFLIFSD